MAKAMSSHVAVVLCADAASLKVASEKVTSAKVEPVAGGLAMSSDIASTLFAGHLVAKALRRAGVEHRVGIASTQAEAQRLAAGAAPSQILASEDVGRDAKAQSLADVEAVTGGALLTFE